MRTGGRTKDRRPFINRYSRKGGFLPTVTGLVRRMRRTELAPRAGGTVNRYSSVGGPRTVTGGGGENIQQTLAIGDDALGEDLFNIGKLTFNDGGLLTINGADTITVTDTYHTVQGAAGAADDLDTINGFSDEMLLLLQRASGVGDVTIKHAVGNILIVGNADIVLDDDHDFVIAVYDSANSVWVVFGAGGAAPHNLLDGATHPDTVAQAVSVGSLVYGDNTPAWNELVRVVPAGAALRNVLGLDQGDTVPGYKVTLDAVAPAAVGNAASAGTSLLYSHRDHVHAHPAGLNYHEHALALGVAGPIPVGATSQFADFTVAIPHNATLLRMKGVVKTGVAVTKTVRLRRSTDCGATWADVANFVFSFTAASCGGRWVSVDPADVNVNEDDLFQLETEDANAASGTNLVVEVVYKMR